MNLTQLKLDEGRVRRELERRNILDIINLA